MKQNERILMYLVGGFLAVIMVIAVLVGNNAEASTEKRSSEEARGLDAMFDGPEAGKGEGSGEEGAATDPSGSDLGVGEDPDALKQPLVASKPTPVSELVEQYIGESRRHFTVRIVTVRPGDSLNTILQTWCGSVSPHDQVVRSLNEQMPTVLRPGDEITVPWVEDEVIWAAYEARQPSPAATMSDVGTSVVDPTTGAAATSTPTFQVPGGSGATGTDDAGAAAAPTGGTKTYVVKPGDSLWKIAAGLYGDDKADRMVKEILRINPGTTIKIKPKQELQVPISAN
jgi:hypothetical protein